MPLDPGDVIAGYHFSIELDGVAMAQFKEVSGISSEITVIEHRENTKAGLPVMKKLPGMKKAGDIVLKRGRTDDNALWEWHKKVQDGDIKGARKNGSIVLFDYAQGELSRWNFTAGWPSKVNLGALQAQGNDVLVEECTIVHEGLAPA
jgi:phage tail-like protein